MIGGRVESSLGGLGGGGQFGWLRGEAQRIGLAANAAPSVFARRWLMWPRFDGLLTVST